MSVKSNRYSFAIAFVIALVVLSASPLTSQTARTGTTEAAQLPVRLTRDQLVPSGVTIEETVHAGRNAIRLIEVDNKRQGGIAVLKEVVFQDGVIEVDVAGRRGPYAVPDDRGFIGVAFRVQPGNDKYEYVYLRPDNGRADDQVRRNHSTQYAAHPDFPWPRLRKESPEKYESYVDLEPGAWTRMRVEVSGTRMRLFVHDAPQPVLIVNDMKYGAGMKGGVALFIGAGTEGFFSAVRVTGRSGSVGQPFIGRPMVEQR
jgi:hypothetical protein